MNPPPALLVGPHIGEGYNSARLYMSHLRKVVEEDLGNVVMIRFRPRDEMPPATIRKIVSFCVENRLYFVFLFAMRTGAPGDYPGKIAPALLDWIKRTAGDLFLGDTIAEMGGLAAWFDSNFAAIPKTLQPFRTVRDYSDGAAAMKSHVTRLVQAERKMGMPMVWGLEATLMHQRSGWQAGVDRLLSETLAYDPELMLSGNRGVSRSMGNPPWGVYIPMEWYGGTDHKDELKFHRYALSLRHALLRGAGSIFVESPVFGLCSYGSRAGADDPTVRRYRDMLGKFYRLTRRIGPLGQGPICKSGFVMGINDSHNGYGCARLWAQNRWPHGPAERSWQIVERIHEPTRWSNPFQLAPNGRVRADCVPGGTYDLVPAESSAEHLGEYETLVFMGWNTMTGELYRKLIRYVRGGGTLLMSAAHLRTGVSGDNRGDFLRGGKLTELFGCSLLKPRPPKVYGLRFLIQPSRKNFRLPVVPAGYMCDPWMSYGSMSVCTVRVKDAKVLARVVGDDLNMSDNGHRLRQDTAFLTEHRLGKGRAYLVCADEYPGHPSLMDIYDHLTRQLLLSIPEPRPVHIPNGVRHGWYRHNGKDRLVLLNVSPTDSARVRLENGTGVTVKPGQLVSKFLDQPPD